MRRLIFAVGFMLSSCGGGPQSPSAECKQWLQCEAQFAPSTAGIDAQRMDVGGSCWADPDSANACTAECKRKIADTKAMMRNDAPACG